MSKDCGNHGERRKRVIRFILSALLVLVFLALLATLIIWLVLRPTKPTFILQDATVYAFNVSTPPNLLTLTIQVTLTSRNPNARIGIYYDRLDLYASYRSQQVTLRTRIGPAYQGHKDVNVWSPFLYGASVPIAPFIGLSLTQDQSSGMVLILIKADGRVRWKVGSFISGGYHLHVTCPAYITLGGSRSSSSAAASNVISLPGNAVKYQLTQRCSINV